MPIITIDANALPLLKSMRSHNDDAVTHIGKPQANGTLDVVITIPTYKRICASRLNGETYTSVILRLSLRDNRNPK